jgi:hypothetical protein
MNTLIPRKIIYGLIIFGQKEHKNFRYCICIRKDDDRTNEIQMIYTSKQMRKFYNDLKIMKDNYLITDIPMKQLMNNIEIALKENND